MSKTGNDAIEVTPKFVNFAIDEKRRGPKIVRYKLPTSEMQRLASVFVVSKPRPSSWPCVSRSYETNELLAVRIADII